MFIVAKEQTVEIIKQVLLLWREKTASAAGRCRLPASNKHRDGPRVTKPLGSRIERSVACPREQRGNFVNPPIDTFLISDSTLDKTEIELHFRADIFSCFVGDSDIVMSANSLLKPKSDQDSANDRNDFPRELAPSMGCLWLVNVHSARMLC